MVEAQEEAAAMEKAAAEFKVQATRLMAIRRRPAARAKSPKSAVQKAVKSAEASTLVRSLRTLSAISNVQVRAIISFADFC
jgi:hypothetical protein